MFKTILASFIIALTMVIPSEATAPVTMLNPSDSSVEMTRSCGDVMAMFQWIMKGHDERVVFTSDDGKIAVFYNKKTQYFTILKIITQNVDGKTEEKACLEESARTANFSLRVFGDFKS